MTLRKYLIFLTACTALCWLTFGLAVNYTNPNTAGWLGFSFFYLSLFVSIVGTFSLVGFVFRMVFNKDEKIYKKIDISSRQSIILGLLFIIALVLQSQRFLTWWNFVILLVIVSLIEIFLISYRKFR
jgi:hypothetical protein